ncbi:hypothetical protein J3A83DRAFT_4087534 [Scleroderma citrinum]
MTSTPEEHKTTYLQVGISIVVSSETLKILRYLDRLADVLFTAVTYNEVARKLQCSGFHWLQYSDWACDPIDAGDAYWMMLFLLRICPPSKFQSTVKAIKIHHIANWAFDVTHDIQLGGEYSPHLKGPTPAGLVPANIPAFVPLTLQQLPQFTQESQEVMDINNWRI